MFRDVARENETVEVDKSSCNIDVGWCDQYFTTKHDICTGDLYLDWWMFCEETL
jgi:hypothetical protein